MTQKGGAVVIYVEDYGDFSKYTGNLLQYSRWIGRCLIVYTAGGFKFSGVLCGDMGNRVILGVTEKHPGGRERDSVMIFKHHIVAVELLV
jgi:hypothetical protein